MKNKPAKGGLPCQSSSGLTVLGSDRWQKFEPYLQIFNDIVGKFAVSG